MDATSEPTMDVAESKAIQNELRARMTPRESAVAAASALTCASRSFRYRWLPGTVRAEYFRSAWKRPSGAQRRHAYPPRRGDGALSGPAIATGGLPGKVA